MTHSLKAALVVAGICLSGTGRAIAQAPPSAPPTQQELLQRLEQLEKESKAIRQALGQQTPPPPPQPGIVSTDPLGESTLWWKGEDGNWTSRVVDPKTLDIVAHWNGNPEYPNGPASRYATEQGGSGETYVFVSAWKDGNKVYGPGWFPANADGTPVPISQPDPRNVNGDKTLYIKLVKDAPAGRGWVRVVLNSKDMKTVRKDKPWNDGVFPRDPGNYVAVPSILGDEASGGTLAMLAVAGVNEGGFDLPRGLYETTAPGELKNPPSAQRPGNGNYGARPGNGNNGPRPGNNYGARPGNNGNRGGARPTPSNPPGGYRPGNGDGTEPGTVPGSIPSPYSGVRTTPSNPPGGYRPGNDGLEPGTLPGSIPSPNAPPRY